VLRIGVVVNVGVANMLGAGIAQTAGCITGIAACTAGFYTASKRSVKFVTQGEQLRVEKMTETVVHNGPCTVCLNPLSYRSAIFQSALSLGPADYAKVKDTVKGEERIEKGPQLLFRGAYEEFVGPMQQAVTLNKTEYIIVSDRLSGKDQTVRGPAKWFPGPYDKVGPVRTAIALQEDEYIKIQDKGTGQRWIKKGRDLVFMEPTWSVETGVQKAWTLKSYEYVRLLDSLTGIVRVERGEGVIFPTPTEELLDGQKLMAVELKSNEYVKIMDKKTGKIRVEKGSALVFYGATDQPLENGKKAAIEIDEEHAVLVRDSNTGQLRLVQDKQLFFPGAADKIEDVQSLIRLADHEAVIVKDSEGVLNFHYGDPKKSASGAARSFFLPPYSEMLKLYWSSGLRRAKRDLIIERFDCRPNFLWNEIDCRTQDNVELVLETTLFWEVIDLAAMVRKTGNLPADIYNQIRSLFIKHVAQVTLKGFMEQLHLISRKVFETDPDFYSSRGVKIHSLEVTKYMCSEKRTSEVLQQIIEETTNRLNRLSQAESENEVRIYKMQGQLEQEKLNAQLLEIQHANQKSEAAVGGEAEAERVSAFMEKLEKKVPKLEDRMTIWQTLRKTDALSVVSQGGAHLYYTPNDVNLSIKSD